MQTIFYPYNDVYSQINGDAKKKEQEKNAKKIDALLEENPELYKYATQGIFPLRILEHLLELTVV